MNAALAMFRMISQATFTPELLLELSIAGVVIRSEIQVYTSSIPEAIPLEIGQINQPVPPLTSHSDSLGLLSCLTSMSSGSPACVGVLPFRVYLTYFAVVAVRRLLFQAKNTTVD